MTSRSRTISGFADLCAFDFHDVVFDGVDLTGTTILITGISAGLGVEATRAFTTHGASVIGGVRDLTKAETNLRAAGVDLDRVELHHLDVATLDLVRAFTDEVLATEPTLDVIMANAGIMACPQGETADGFELQFGTNHLGHFVLVNRLLGALRDGGRIVVLSSAGHRLSDVDLDDPNFTTAAYDAWVAYGRAKTANVLFAVELDRRLRDRGVRATALHPGGIMLTELGRHLTDETLGQLIDAHEGHDVEFKTIQAGAATEVWAAIVAHGPSMSSDLGLTPVPRASPIPAAEILTSIAVTSPRVSSPPVPPTAAAFPILAVLLTARILLARDIYRGCTRGMSRHMPAGARRGGQRRACGRAIGLRWNKPRGPQFVRYAARSVADGRGPGATLHAAPVVSGCKVQRAGAHKAVCRRYVAIVSAFRRDRGHSHSRASRGLPRSSETTGYRRR